MNRRLSCIGRGRPLQLLLAGAAALLFLPPAAGLAAPAQAAPATLSADDIYFMPDGTQTVGQIRVGRVLGSEFLKQVWTAFPDAKKAFEQSTGQMTGGDANNIDRMCFGFAKLDFTAPTAPTAIEIIHLKNSIKVDDFEAAVKKGVPGNPFNPTYTFTDTKVGKYTMTEVKMALPSFAPPPPPKGGAAAPPPPPPPNPPISVVALTMPNDKTIVIGQTSAVQAVLTRDKAPVLGDRLQAIMKQTDFDADVAFAVNVKDGMVFGKGGMLKTPVDMVDALSVTVKVATDIDVSATATCADAKAAAAVSDGLKADLAAARDFLTKPPAPGAPPGVAPSKPPQELLDLLDVKPEASGSTVTVQKTIKAAAVIAIIKSGIGGPIFGPPPPPPPANPPGLPAPPASADK